MVVKPRSQRRTRHFRSGAPHQDNTNLYLGIAMGISILGAAMIYGLVHKDNSPIRTPSSSAIVAPARTEPAPVQPERAAVKPAPAPDASPVIAERAQPAPKKVLQEGAMNIDPNAPKPFWMKQDDMPARK